jgi:hypothetical protein
MKPALSVYSALRESFYLWVQNFWIVTVVALATRLPQLGLSHLQLMLAPIPSSPAHVAPGFYPVSAAVSFASFAALLILAGVSTAGILGVLTRPATESDPWPAMRRSIAANTWTLARLYFLIAVIAALPMVLIVVAVAELKIKVTSLLAVWCFALYLILVKYALADPLVVVEGMGARAGLKRSWQMTRGAFWYVLGCYAFLAVLQMILRWLFAPTNLRSATSGWSGLLADVAEEVVAPLWVIVSWVMYNQIKAAKPGNAPTTEETHAP